MHQLTPVDPNPTPQEAQQPPSAMLLDDLSHRKWRFRTIEACFIFLTLIVVIQLVRYQIFRGDDLWRIPEESNPPAARGVIVDRDGELLAIDRFYYQVTATPSHIKTDEDRRELAHELERLIGLPADETMQTLLEFQENDFAILAKEITLEQAELLAEYRQQQEAALAVFPLQDVHLTAMPRRYYPQEDLASQVVGFVRAERFGFYGVEGYYDAFLPADGVGLTSNSTHPIDELSPETRRYLPSAASKDLVLSIDRTVQWIIEEELANALEEYKATSGTVIVMEPETGAILGLANFPTFDPNRYSEVSFERYANPAISAQYEPGSIFKIITMAAGLDSGLFQPTTIFSDTGWIIVGGRSIFNSDRMGHGDVTATEALVRSLNVVTAQVAVGLGAEEFYNYVRRFGFGQATEVDLSGEINGLIKTPLHPDWSQADLGTNSFGQGLAVSPMQMINAAASIANGGRLMQPYVVQARVVDGVVQQTQPTVIRSTISAESAGLLTQMMIEAVETGAPKAAVPGYTIAGKSGTAQIPVPGGYLKDLTIVSFVGFAPADDPQFVLLVKLDRPDPDISEWATQTAAPVFGAIAQRLFQHLNIPPDEIRLGQLAAAGN